MNSLSFKNPQLEVCPLQVLADIADCIPYWFYGVPTGSKCNSENGCLKIMGWSKDSKVIPAHDA
jgi:hypothetical protein